MTQQTSSSSERTRLLSTSRGGAVVVLASVIASAPVSPTAGADPLDDNVQAAVIAARAGACTALKPNPVVRQAAADINRSTDKWVNFDSRARPTPDALPVLKDLGYGGTKAFPIYGAAPDIAIAIKAAVLQGFAVIPDCSYTDVGANALWNDSKQEYFVTVVLAG